MKRSIACSLVLCVGAVGTLNSAAQAQVATLFNPSFETPWLCDPARPGGWRLYNDATWHSVLPPASGFAPQAMPPGVTPHGGDGLIRLVAGGLNFQGAETEDRLRVAPAPITACFGSPPLSSFPWPWVAYTYQPELDGDSTNNNTCLPPSDNGSGTPTPHGPDPVNVQPGDPITISGWYMIPADAPIIGTKCGLKVSFKSDFLTYAATKWVHAGQGRRSVVLAPFVLSVTPPERAREPACRQPSPFHGGRSRRLPCAPLEKTAR